MKDSSLPPNIITSLAYTQKNQVKFPLLATIFFDHNKTVFLSDCWYLKYSSYTYGLGINKSPADSLLLNYQHIKLYESVLFQFHPHLFIGGGIALDYIWNIGEKYPVQGIETHFEKYGPTVSISSGI